MHPGITNTVTLSNHNLKSSVSLIFKMRIIKIIMLYKQLGLHFIGHEAMKCYEITKI
jgi:hypothetical protein